MRRLIVCAALMSMFLAGCGSEVKMSGPMSSRTAKGKDKAVKQDGRPAAPAVKEAAGGERGPADREDAPQKKDGADKQLERKIIYTGRIELVADDFDKAETLLLGIISEQGGYIANSAVTGERGTSRSGTWTIRIPAAKGDKFREEVKTIARLRSSSLDSRDITDEYYDTQAAIKNMEAEQEGIRKLYDRVNASQNPKYSELMEVKRELSRVTRDIELLKGRLQRWNKETEYSTYTVTIYDGRGYVPPEPPDFSTSIGRTWHNSLEALQSFGKGVVLVAVAVAPWLAVLAVVVVPLWLILRRRKKPAPPPEPVIVAEVADES